jgi:hypothetical protein
MGWYVKRNHEREVYLPGKLKIVKQHYSVYLSCEFENLSCLVDDFFHFMIT